MDSQEEVERIKQKSLSESNIFNSKISKLQAQLKAKEDQDQKVI